MNPKEEKKDKKTAKKGERITSSPGKGEGHQTSVLETWRVQTEREGSENGLLHRNKEVGRERLTYQ